MRPAKTFNVPVSNGLLEHCPRMRDSVWLFIYLLDKQTRGVDKNGHGKVSGGMPIRDSDIAGTLKLSVRTISRMRSRLRRRDYITARRTPFGYVYAIPKPKKWQQKEAEGSDKNVQSVPKSDVTQPTDHSESDRPSDRTQSVGGSDTTCRNKEEVTRDYKRSSSGFCGCLFSRTDGGGTLSGLELLHGGIR